MNLRIMTTNIWGDYFNNPANVRKDNMYKVYENYKPDVIGFQEVEKSWYKSGMLEKLAEEYTLIGTSLRDSFVYVPLAFKKKFRLKANGYEYLDYTTDDSKAITWAVIASYEKTFAVCNTHFWWMTGEEHDLVREKNAAQLAKLMKVLYERFNCPVFAFGDMNSCCTSKIFTKIYPNAGIAQLYDEASEKDNICSHHGDPIKNTDGSFSGQKTNKDHTHSIDHIVGFGEGYMVLRYKVVEEQYALDATDHSPVYADIVL